MAAVLVTGASTGIGRSCAEHLASLGLTVFGGVRRTEDADALRAGKIEPVMLDVTDASAIANAVEQVAAATEHRGLAGLVNNAGIAVPGPLEYLPIDDLRRQLEVNVIGQMAVTQAFLPMLRQTRGRIVFMSSVSGFLAAPLLGPYSASKFALEALSDSLRMELATTGITVSVIEPANIVTPIWAKGRAQGLTSQGDASEVESRYAKLIAGLQRASYAIEKHGEPPELVARAVAHALLAKRPRTRYRVGRGASMMGLVKLLPDRLRDTLVLRSFGG
jgi:NAD(P)-dependent dehydrogenase (short-subunit alcohol dehydrogenase family)